MSDSVYAAETVIELNREKRNAKRDIRRGRESEREGKIVKNQKYGYLANNPQGQKGSTDEVPLSDLHFNKNNLLWVWDDGEQNLFHMNVSQHRCYILAWQQLRLLHVDVVYLFIFFLKGSPVQLHAEKQ